MHETEPEAHSVVHWLAELDHLERWCAGNPDPEKANKHRLLLRRMREGLQALARNEEAVPAETPGEPMPRRTGRGAMGQVVAGLKQRPRPADGPQRDARPKGFNATCAKRDALLRLSVWRVLREWREALQRAPALGDPFDEMLLRVARNASDAPPGLAPALTYASQPKALVFFNDTLRRALRSLAACYPKAAPALAALADLPRFDDSGAAVQRWGRAWTVAVVGVYLDWLKHHAGDSIEGAMADVWRRAGATQLRFKAPNGLAVLPTAERDMSLDLWTGLVSAQILAHDPDRFADAADGAVWHRVRLPMHDLGERDERIPGSRGMHTLFRGLGVEMLYQVVFADAVARALPVPVEDFAMTTAARHPISPAPPAVGFSWLGAGQQPNLRLLQGWASWPPAGLAPSADRRAEARWPGVAAESASAADALHLSSAQQAVYDAWLQREAAAVGGSHALDAAELSWQGPLPGGEACDELGLPWVDLGSAALWSTAGEEAQWLDLAVGLCARGEWHELTLRLHDVAMDGVLRTRLFAQTAALTELAGDPGRVVQALADPGRCFWSVCRLGLGAFVLAAVDLDREATA